MNRSNRRLQLAAVILASLAFVLAITALILALRAGRSDGDTRAEAPRQTARAEQAEADDPADAEQDDSAQSVPIEPVPADDHDEPVQNALDGFVSSQGGTWDVYYESLSDGAYAAAQSGHGAEPRSVSASVIKLFVMGAVYDAIDRGALAHDNVYTNLRSMITASDNTACNTLVRALGNGDAGAGIQAVNRFAQSIGCTGTQMTRLMLQQTGTENYVTARDCATILRLIYRGACVSADASAEMLALLRGQTVNNRLPASLPADTVVAHKTGDLANLSCGDVGIVFSPAGDYILCVLSNYSTNDAQTVSAIATLSRTVYDVVNQ